MTTKMRCLTLRWSILLGACLATSLPAILRADQPAAGQLWLINTRRASCGEGAADASQLEYSRLDGNQWTSLSQAAFLAADDPALPTVFFLHGNRSDEADAVSEGYGLYQAMQCQAPNQAMRYVIWSWPADHVAGGNRLDVQVKAARCDGQSCYLAQVLAPMNPQVRVSLVGYSFGARIITGAMHLLGGGELAGTRVARPNPTAERAAVRAVLVAAAEDCYWLSPGSCHGLALSQLERLLITVNCADSALRYYPRLYGRGGPEALGFTGPSCGSDGAKTELLDVSCSVGRTHAWACYSADLTLQARLPWYAFLASASK